MLLFGLFDWREISYGDIFPMLQMGWFIIFLWCKMHVLFKGISFTNYKYEERLEGSFI